MKHNGNCDVYGVDGDYGDDDEVNDNVNEA